MYTRTSIVLQRPLRINEYELERAERVTRVRFTEVKNLDRRDNNNPSMSIGKCVEKIINWSFVLVR